MHHVNAIIHLNKLFSKFQKEMESYYIQTRGNTEDPGYSKSPSTYFFQFPS